MGADVRARDVEEAYHELLWVMKVRGKLEDSRNGRVLTIQSPFHLTINNPMGRVLYNEERNANPFFHVMEFVWMLSGSSSVEWISQFNKRMVEYANNGRVNGAYGYRWSDHFDVNQIEAAIRKLRDDRGTRQAVIAMWDPNKDNTRGYNDYPCNTHIYFRVVDDALSMTVCNRSNDLVWGMLGANVVHMTLLQELVARSIGAKIGEYHVLTNNLHIYEHHWKYLDNIASPRPPLYSSYPLLEGNASYEDLRLDAIKLVAGADISNLYCGWFRNVAYPIFYRWKTRKEGYAPTLFPILAEDWRVACDEWIARKDVASPQCRG